MNFLIRTGRFFYGIGLIVYAILQYYYKDFRTVIVPQWPVWLHAVPVVYIAGLGLAIAGLFISGIIPLRQSQVKKGALWVGAFFFIILLFCHVPLALFISPNSPLHLGVWAEALKELAFCGGAFVIAGSYPTDEATEAKITLPERAISLLIPFGRIFFSTTMILFGVS